MQCHNCCNCETHKNYNSCCSSNNIFLANASTILDLTHTHTHHRYLWNLLKSCGQLSGCNCICCCSSTNAIFVAICCPIKVHRKLFQPFVLLNENPIKNQQTEKHKKWERPFCCNNCCKFQLTNCSTQTMKINLGLRRRRAKLIFNASS